ncbi:variant erythrocyte surface antigen-1 family protein [Babesia caballi]|uniref:Variant erythrocyte surface antigen-1 family protein n=1 Tax=Babesia caballi TaxID=5871 RepID=A0AAV4LNB5_BABCB|nr:variant erythrocyte surface antigen-1 family protein [Babesia caballi]
MALPNKRITDCPSNLKEAIDWILRVTGKDAVNGGSSDGTKDLADAVEKLLEDVQSSSNKLNETLSKIKGALGTSSSGLIDNLATGLATFIGYKNSGSSKDIGTGGIAVGRNGETNQPPSNTKEESSGKGYYLTYNPTESGCKWDEHVKDAEQGKFCARIFLSILPIIWSALSYLYFMCSKDDSDGGWEEMTLGEGLLRDFMISMWFGPSRLQANKKGDHVTSALSKFTELEAAKSASTYAGFVKKLREEGIQKWKESSGHHTVTASNFLSGLYFLSQAYFRHQQSLQAKDASKAPSTIRQMLYFLAALPYTAQFGELDAYITNHFKRLVPDPTGQSSDQRPDADLKLPVADSSRVSISNSGIPPGETLSAADLKSHLLSSCLFAPALLGVIQDHSASDESEPWLHRLFSNSEFSFRYPSGPGLLHTLSDYSYALQFQLYFLYNQCGNNRTIGCGLNECRYGKSINTDPKNKSVQSHICRTEFKKSDHTSGHSNPDQCNHVGCGSGGKSSPLHAFLTDTLTPFLAANPGSMSQVPMGFANVLRETPSAGYQGGHINFVLGHLCGNSQTPLRRLCEQLGCLTKRTPRTLGDLFGFMWHLNGQLFHNTRPTLESLAAKLVNAIGQNNPSKIIPQFLFDLLNRIAQPSPSSGSPAPSVLSRSLESMAPTIPFLYQIFMAKDPNTLPGELFDLTQHCHKKKAADSGIGAPIEHEPHSSSPIPKHQCSTSPADLWSLCKPVVPKPTSTTDTHANCRGQNCGGYLYPLTYTFGSTFAPNHASSYLSCFLHLTDDLEAGLRDILDDFRNIDCNTSGCKPRSTGTCSCPKGQHGTSSGSACFCESVVECGGVLPLLYRHGFHFYNAYWLNDTSTKRTCGKFSQQLSNVLAENAPLAKLLETIDSFLYLFRIYFFYNLSSFWLCSLAILLYFIFYGIDVLHLKSHVHFPSSHTVPPVALLTTGKAPALTQLTYYMP